MSEADPNPAVDTVAAKFEIKVTDDRVRVFFSCDAEALGCPNLYDQVLERLKLLRIVYKPNKGVFDAVSAKARTMEHPSITNLPLVSAAAAVPPTDGCIEWSRNYFDTHYRVDPKTGEIDFKNRVGDPTASQGELLVKVTRPKPGTPGMDVYGSSLPVRAPINANLSTGKGVQWDEEAGGFRAACSGRVSLHDNQLQVDPVLRISGDVGGATGNIHHIGPVLIEGDVEAGFVVEATGDVEVHGMIYGATVKCGGNLAIAGGVNANNQGLLDVQGDLHAKFFLNATVRSHGNVIVQKEIYRCHVETGGAVLIPKGRIVGGEVVATRGITVWEAGSVSDSITILNLRADASVVAELQKIKATMEDAQEQVQALRRTLRDFQKQAALLGPAGKKKMDDADKEVRRLEDWMVGQVRRSQTITRQIEGDQVAVIQVIERVHPGVWFKIHHGDFRTEVEMLGPIFARLNRTKGVVTLGGEDELPAVDEGAAPSAAA
jgi:uncharacterized protein (DUF342 family)